MAASIFPRPVALDVQPSGIVLISHLPQLGIVLRKLLD
jgi:hypothetical protein